MCGKSILNNIDKAKDRGYFIELHYIGVEDVDIAKERVVMRVKQGGHGIAEKDIERRYIDTRKFVIYKNGKPVRVSHDVPMWYEKFIENVK